MRSLMVFLFLVLSQLVLAQHKITELDSLIQQKSYALAENKALHFLHENSTESLRERLGDIYSLQAKWQDAANCYEKLSEEHPKNAMYHFKYGGVLGMMAVQNKLKSIGLIGDIKKEFTTAAILDKTNIGSRWALVELYVQLPGIFGGSYKKATLYADELLQISKVEGLLAKGYIAKAKGDEKAENYFQQKALGFIGLVPDNYERNEINYQLGTLAVTYQTHLQQGLQHLQQYVKNYTVCNRIGLAEAYHQMAIIYRLQQSKQQAYVAIQKALALAPESIAAQKELIKIKAL
ncbi:tetratricopeptide repeat protein [Zhouia sp. PK063]|uniref:tetratricopeptide repeat protein n=1 Tax=Zhouia sp. PK063 TaxID=3373602 RepID=UPI00378BB447